MEQKRDSRMQRAKNLQYKSKGRPRQNQPVAPVDTTAVEVEEEASGPDAAEFGRIRNLGSNWDRYEEAEVGQSDHPQEGGAVLKRSEGLDYSALLEEADALLSSGGAYLLKHYEIDLDEEDPFSPSGTVEEPMPLQIDLTSLNSALLSLSMAERLGLEDELFFANSEQESASTKEVGALDSTSTPSADAVQPVKGKPQGSSPTERDVSRSSPTEKPTSTLRLDRGQNLKDESALQLSDNRSGSSIESIESRQTQSGRPLDSKNPGAGKDEDSPLGFLIPSSSPGELHTPGIAQEDSKTRSHSELSSAEVEQNEDEDLLNLLLGGTDRPGAAQKKPTSTATSTSVRREHAAVVGGPPQLGASRTEEQSRGSSLPIEPRHTLEGMTGASERSLPSTTGGKGSTMPEGQGKRTGQKPMKGIAADQDFDSWLDSIG